MSDSLFPDERSIIGQEIDGFQIEGVLGRGGMGIVYKAENIDLDRMVALKVIDPNLARNDELVKRFRAEAKALARLTHPNIVLAYALRQTELGLYIVMEFVEGESLADYMKQRGALPWREAMPLMKQTLHALAYAHAHHIVHRDIKPRNIMVTPQGQIKMMDFGLAKMLDAGAGLTRTMTRGGTLYYMSPEQVKSLKNVDHRADLYSVGMTFYEMLTGGLPFNRKDSEFTILRTIVEAPFPPPKAPDGLPEELTRIIMKSLEKDPAVRYQSADEMREALEALERKPDAPPPAPLPMPEPDDYAATTVLARPSYEMLRKNAPPVERVVPPRQGPVSGGSRPPTPIQPALGHRATRIALIVLAVLIMVLVVLLMVV